MWIDRSGQESPLSIGASNYYYPRLSPDGNRLAVTHGDDAASLHVWIYDLERGTQNPSHSRPTRTTSTRYGRPIVEVWFTTPLERKAAFFVRPQTAPGRRSGLTSSQALQRPESFSPDGALLIYSQDTLAFAADLHVLSLEGDRVSRPLLNAEFAERVASISPNGRWVAYSSNESGEYRVYVRPFPNVDDGKWQISTGVGWVPRWSADGKELLFRTSQDTIQAAQIQGEDPFLPGPPSVVLSAGIYAVFGASPNFDVAATASGF